MANVFRADHVGPLVKPAALVAAEQAFAAGTADAVALAAAQDAAVRQALDLQKEVVMTVLTDGELRRPDGDAPYASALTGLTRVGGAPRTPLRSAHAATGVIGQRQRLTAVESRALGAGIAPVCKISVLSPSALAVRYFAPGATSYRSLPELAAAFGPVIKAEIDALVGEGIGYIQLVGAAYHALFEGAGRDLLALPGVDSAGVFDELLAVDAGILKAAVRSPRSTLGLHVPRVEGAAEAGDRYERLAARLMGALPVDRLLLEYAEPTRHDFESLRALPAGAMATLGLVRTESDPEGIGELIARLEKAAGAVPEERLALSPRRGFRNTPGLTAEEAQSAQRRTLVRASEVVQQFWGLEV